MPFFINDAEPDHLMIVIEHSLVVNIPHPKLLVHVAASKVSGAHSVHGAYPTYNSVCSGSSSNGTVMSSKKSVRTAASSQGRASRRQRWETGHTVDSALAAAADLCKHNFALEGAEDDETKLDWPGIRASYHAGEDRVKGYR